MWGHTAVFYHDFVFQESSFQLGRRQDSWSGLRGQTSGPRIDFSAICWEEVGNQGVGWVSQNCLPDKGLPLMWPSLMFLALVFLAKKLYWPSSTQRWVREIISGRCGASPRPEGSSDCLLRGGCPGLAWPSSAGYPVIADDGIFLVAVNTVVHTSFFFKG